ncbi:MAG: T9SS type A sorting domain-containing protein [Bacteroidetes bacterium]|nr:T9SS type A sorting domain-containing protein [Bacteroidota bacterium]
MKKILFFFCFILMALVIQVNAQTSSQTFGVGTGTHTTGTSTSFLPNPTGSGTTFVRMGTGGGSINLEPALVSPAFGNGSIVRGVAPTTASVNKITPIVSYTASTQFYTKFDILLGNSTGGNTGAVDGTWFFFQGEGTSYSDANAFSGAQVFTGLQFIFSAGGNFTANYRNGAAWTLLTPGVQGVKYTVEIIGNNSFASINYTYGSPQSVAPNTYDIWVNGVLAGNDLNKGLLASGANISSMMFYGISSTGNAANLFTDNISVSNTIPALICPASIPVTANVTPGNSVCAGTSITLTGSGANTYTWTDGLNTPNNGVAFIPTTTATYTVTGTDGNGCTGTSSITVTVNLNPTTTASASPTTICQGSSTNLSSTGATSYVWNPGGLAGANVSVSPNATTTYTVTGTTGVCTATSTVTVTVDFTPAPTPVTATPSLLCTGGISQLNATGIPGSIQSWYTVPSGGVAIGTSLSGANFPVSPAITTTYYVESATSPTGSQTFNYTGVIENFTVPAGITSITIDAKGAQGGNTNGGRGASIIGTFNVTPGQVLGIVVGGQGVVNNCGGPGASGGGGGGSYIWDLANLAQPLIVAGAGGGGNTNWAGGCVNGIDAVITPDGTQGNGALSALGGVGGNGGFGNAASGTGSGGAGWLTAGQNSTWGGGCTGGLPPFLFNGGSGAGGFGPGGEGGFGGGGGAVCGCGGGGGYSGGGGGEGSSCRAGGGGGGSFNAGTNQVNTAGVQFGNGQVTISWVGSSCPSTPRVPVTVTVGTTPTITASASANPVCAGVATTLTGGGAGIGGSYVWSGGVTDGVAFNPLATTTYTVTGTNASGCTSTSSITITVNVTPAPTPVTASPSIICAGNNSNLNAISAGNTINWYTVPSGGVSIGNTASGANLLVTPANTTTYYAESQALAGGNQTFSYTGSMQNFIVPPGVTSLEIECWGAQGGANWVNNVNFGGYSKGTFNVTPGENLNIYVGNQPLTLAGGFNGGGAGDGAGRAGGGASDVRQGGNALANRIIVAGGGGGAGFWSGIHVVGGVGGGGGLNGGDGYRDPNYASNPGGQGGTQVGSGTGTCVNFNQLTMSGGFGFGGSPATFNCGCEGYGGGGGWYGGAGSGNCRGGGGGSGYIAPGAINTIATSGVRIGDGQVILTWSGNGCASATRTPVTVTVNPLPTVNASASPASVCIGGSTQLIGTGATSYIWNPGALAGSPTVSPVATTTYSVLATDGNGCTGTSEVTVSVNPLPTVTASPASQTICENAQATVNGGGAVSYVWTGGISNGVPFTVTGANVYTVTGTDGNGCENTATAEVLMNAAPIVNATATPSTTCNLTSVNPCATGAVSYVWTGGLSNCTPFVATTTDTYTVTGTDGAGCTGTSSVTVTVTPASGVLAPTTSNQSQDHGDDFNINYYAANCDLIATVDDGAGGNVLGLTTSTVNVDATASFHNGQPFVRRWYQITPTTNGSADVKLYINQTDFDDYNAAVVAPYLPLPTGPGDASGIANIRITKNDDGGLGNNPIVITPAVSWNGTYWELSFNTPSFSQFRVHSVNPGNVPLPVTVTSFSGTKLESSDKLSWITSSEQNNAYFNLQHSTDGMSFSTIAKVASKAPNGNSNTALSYTATNNKPALGHNYYRLQQVDIDNKVSVHAQIVDLIWGANGSTVSIYPNPTTDILNIDLYATAAQNTTVKLLDMSGRVIRQVQAKSAVGMNNIQLSLGEIASGVYTVQVYENNHLTHTSKVKKND